MASESTPTDAKPQTPDAPAESLGVEANAKPAVPVEAVPQNSVTASRTEADIDPAAIDRSMPVRRITEEMVAPLIPAAVASVPPLAPLPSSHEDAPTEILSPAAAKALLATVNAQVQAQTPAQALAYESTGKTVVLEPQRAATVHSDVQPRFAEFAKAVMKRERILILTHDNPDPDAMASAIGIYTILKDAFHIEAVIGHGGTIGRAENKLMVKNLDIPIYSLNLLGDLTNFDGIILVDTQTESKYHSLPNGLVPLAVFDHHPPSVDKPAGAFVEIQTMAGATSTIVTKYLLAAGVQIPTQVATALMYGIKSDTQNFYRHSFAWDIEAHQALFPLVDGKRLSEIESPPLTRDYFIELRRALDNAMVHGKAVVANLGKIESSDMVPLVADMFLRLESAEWVMVYGIVGKLMKISLRTNDEHADAGKVIRKMIKRKGSGGGHAEMAAAVIPMTAAHPDVQFDIVQSEYVAAFLKEIGETSVGSPLCRPKAKQPGTGRGKTI